MASCTGIERLGPLPDIALPPLEQLSGESILDAFEQRRRGAAGQLERIRHSIRCLQPQLPGEDEIVRIIETAALRGDPGLQVYLRGAGGMLLAAQPPTIAPHSLPWRPPNDLTVYRRSVDEGGSWCLTTAERWHQSFGALAELAATAAATCATTMLISGSFPHVREGAAAHRLVVALESEVTIVDADGGRVLDPGSAHGAGHISEIRTDPGRYALVVEIPEISSEWIRSVFKRKAGFNPRMRADLPYRPRGRIRGYSLEHPTELVQLLNGLAGDVVTSETMMQAELLWRALTPPVAVVDPSWMFPHPGVPISDRIVRLNCPGGFVRFGTDPSEGEWCAAGQVFAVPSHLERLLVELLGEPEGVPFGSLELDCPEGDSDCLIRSLRELAAYGLVRFCPPDPLEPIAPDQPSTTFHR